MIQLACISLLCGVVLIFFGYQGTVNKEYYLVRSYREGRERFALCTARLRLVFGILDVVCAPVFLLAQKPVSLFASVPLLCGAIVIPLYQRFAKKQ